jgi:hypothetical protein
MFSEKSNEVITERGNEVKEIISDIEALKKEWKNEIPDEVFNTNDPSLKDIRFKARKTWFTIVNMLLSEIVEGKTARSASVSSGINPELIKKIKEYLEKRATKLASQELTEPEDIEIADSLLDDLHHELLSV